MDDDAPPDSVRQALVGAVSAGLRQALIALDFDGTLAPLVLDPSTSRLAEGAEHAIVALARRGAQVAIVTGRDAATVLKLSGLAGIGGVQVSGLYGAERWQAGRLTTQPDSPAVALARELLPSAVSEVPGTDGVWIEDKRLSLVVHARRSPEPVATLARLRAPVQAVAERCGLEIHDGHLVLELRLPGYDKGRALRALVAEHRPGVVLFCGDDLGDLPGFELVAALQAEGIAAYSVLVGPGHPGMDGVADVGVPTPIELVMLLRQIADQAGS